MRTDRITKKLHYFVHMDKRDKIPTQQALVGKNITVWLTTASVGRYEQLKRLENTSVTRGGPGGRDRMLAVKRRKNTRKSVCFFL